MESPWQIADLRSFVRRQRPPLRPVSHLDPDKKDKKQGAAASRSDQRYAGTSRACPLFRHRKTTAPRSGGYCLNYNTQGRSFCAHFLCCSQHRRTVPMSSKGPSPCLMIAPYEAQGRCGHRPLRRGTRTAGCRSCASSVPCDPCPTLILDP